jgi:uncharacterized protein
MTTMARWISSFAFLFAGFAVSAGAHYFLWARLIRDFGFSPSLARILNWTVGAVALSVPLAVAASRLVRPESAGWVKPVYYWIGASFLLVMSTLVVDGLRVAYSLVTVGVGGDRSQATARFTAFVAVAIGVAASAWAAREARNLRVKRVEVPLKKLPANLDGLTIIQLSDIHVGPTIRRDFVERVVAEVNALSPDVVVVTGDLVDGSVQDLKHDVAPLANLRSRYGTYFVTGNHEYPVDAPRWCDHLGSLGLRVLRNEYVELERDGAVVHLAGIDDHQSSRFGVGHGADLPKAVAGRDTSRALILLAHEPKAIHEAARHGVDLQLSGHTHGGQVWPFGWLLRLDQPVIAGLAKFGQTMLYVSCGTGYSGPPMRLRAPAEITQLVLRAT